MLFDAFESVPDEDVASTCSGWLKSWGLHQQFTINTISRFHNILLQGNDSGHTLYRNQTAPL